MVDAVHLRFGDERGKQRVQRVGAALVGAERLLKGEHDARRQIDRAERGASLGGNRRRQRKVEGDVPLAGGKQRREGGRVGHIGAAIGGRSQKGIDGRARGIQRRKCALHDVAPPLIAPVVLPRAEQPHLAGGLGGEQLAEGRKKKSGCQIA